MAADVDTDARPRRMRPQLQALSQRGIRFDEQLHEAAHIIGLPSDWHTSPADTQPHLVGARADWALRWILEKWKDGSGEASNARASVAAWHLAACIIYGLPVSIAATRLRDAHFLTLLENTLEENFGADITLQPVSAPAPVSISPGPHSRDVSESSGAVREDAQPSRKRKRGHGTSMPSKRAAVHGLASAQLFDAITTLVQAVRHKANAQRSNKHVVLGESMQMVLRTDSAQAARILKGWLCAVHKLMAAEASAVQPHLTDLSLAVDIWELRVMDSNDDNGASVEEFSSECLVPALLLLQTYQQAQPVDPQLLHTLERLIVVHVLNPSRSAFLSVIASAAGAVSQARHSAGLLSTSLGPLRAKLLQAAQIEDAGDTIPAQLTSLFAAVPYLLHLTLRSSPVRTPKGRNADRPWVQAAVVALAECAGCPLEASQYPTPELAVIALQECLCILSLNDWKLNVDILRDFYWFHSGINARGSNEAIHWPLVAALAGLDPDMFLQDPRQKRVVSNAGGAPEDLARHLFDRISDYAALPSSNDGLACQDGGPARESQTNEEDVISSVIVPKIVVPIMREFARNRNLGGFFDRWVEQLNFSTNTSHRMAEVRVHVWNHNTLVSAIVDILSTSFTPSTVADFLQRYGQPAQAQPSSTLGSDVIVHALLRSIASTDNTESLDPQIRCLWESYSTRVLSDDGPLGAGSAITWSLLNRLATHIWPEDYGSPSPAETHRLHLLIDRASNDLSNQTAVDAKPMALEFLLLACNLLKSAGSHDLVPQKLRKALVAVLKQLPESHDLRRSIAGFCANYVPLLALFDSDTCQPIVSDLLSAISSITDDTRETVLMTLSGCAFANNSGPTVQAAFVSALITALSSQDEQLHSASVRLFLNIQASSITREHREAVLDSLVATLHSRTGHEEAILSILAHLMETPNATARISTKGAALFDLAQRLHDSSIVSPSAYQSLQTLVTRTLIHILPNKDQTQNKRFLEKYESKVASSLKRSHKCFPFKLAVLRGTLLAAAKHSALLSLKQYTAFLVACLDERTMPGSCLLEALEEIPSQAFESHADGFEFTRASLRKILAPGGPLNDSTDMAELAPFNRYPVSTWPLVFATIAKYQLYPSTEWLISTFCRILREKPTPDDDSIIFHSIRDALINLESTQKLQLIHSCLSTRDHDHPTIAYRLVRVLISVLEDAGEVPREQQFDILPILCSLLSQASDYVSFTTLLESITIVIRDKPFLCTQHGIECLLEALLQLSSCNSPTPSTEHASTIYHGLCQTARTILLLHRGRLRGRFHLLLPLLQNLLLCLFIPNSDRGSAHPPWLGSSASTFDRLTPHNAAEYAQLLGTLCSPTRSSVQRLASNPQKDLNDPAKAAREYASQYVYPLLSSYARFQLYGRLEPRVRENLNAGIREVVGVASLDRGTVDSMFAGLGRNEKDVWREVWRDWERAQKRKDMGQDGGN